MIYRDLLNNNSNYGLLNKLYNKNKIEKDIYINNLEENIKLIDKYINIYYFENYDKFLEYPNEIMYKIKQFKNELKDNINFLKQKINNVYRNRILNIIN